MKSNETQQARTEDLARLRKLMGTLTAQVGVVAVLSVVEDWLRDQHEDVEDHLSLNDEERYLFHAIALNGRYKRPGAAKRRLKLISRSSQAVQCPASEAADQPSCGAAQDPQGATSDVAARRSDGPMVIMTIEVSADGERGHSRRIRYELGL